jgi:restriction system protein
MAKRRKQNGPQFLRFFIPVINALQDLGGSGRPSEVVDWIATQMDVPEEDRQVGVRVQNQT